MELMLLTTLLGIFGTMRESESSFFGQLWLESFSVRVT